MKRHPDPETDISPLYGTKRHDIEKEDVGEEEVTLELPGDLRPDDRGEDIDPSDKKPDLNEIREDPKNLRP